MFVIELEFGDVRVVADMTALRPFVTTTFADGASSTFVPPTDDPEFCRIAAWAGYGNPAQYGIEHDIAHSFVAYVLGYEVSRVVWADCHGGTDAARAREGEVPFPTLDDEEHIANRLQRYANTGAEDEHHVIDNVFDSAGGLKSVAHQFMVTARPWLDGGS